MQGEKIEIFPKTIISFKDLHIENKSELIEHLTKMFDIIPDDEDRRKAFIRGKSSWSVPDSFFTHQVFTPLKNVLINLAYDYHLQATGMKSKNKISITKIWVNQQHKGNFTGNHNHLHPQMGPEVDEVQFVSTFYLLAPEDSGELIFNDYTNISRGRVPMECQEDSAVFFPSDLYHQTTPSNNDDTRIMIGFNYMLKK